VQKPAPVPKEFADLALQIMNEDNIDAPANTDDAIKLYSHLKSIID